MENDPVSFVEWMTILMKAQEGLRFHWEFYTTAYLIMVGWLMSMAKKGLTVRNKLIVTVVFLTYSRWLCYQSEGLFLVLKCRI